MQKILIASDSFKGSLSSLEVAESIEQAILGVYPACRTVKLPVADGGEGTVEALVAGCGGQIVSCQVHNPLMKPVLAGYGVLPDGTAVIEMSAASGLSLVLAGERNPMATTTYGTGELINDALSRGCRNFLIGIGGSATNDAGTGMLQALGFRFLDINGSELGKGGQILESIEAVDASRAIPEVVLESSFTIACDVRNPFSGVDGAAYVFAPQKGADEAMVVQLDRGMKRFAGVLKEKYHKDIDRIPGAGAAGGMGGGFLAFLNSRLKPGIDMVLETLRFEERVGGADLVITGEGKLDRQTAMGKAPAGVLALSRKHHVPVVAIGGSVEDAERLNAMGFLAVLPVIPCPVTLGQAMDKDFTRQNIRRTVVQVLRLMGHANSSFG